MIHSSIFELFSLLMILLKRINFTTRARASAICHYEYTFSMKFSVPVHLPYRILVI